MIDDYYKLLHVNAKTSRFKIAYRYKIIAQKLLLNKNIIENFDKEFYTINSAYMILINENARTFYDMLHKIYIQKKHNAISNQTINHYLSFIDTYKQQGKDRADEIIHNNKSTLSKSIKRPFLISYLFGILKFYSRIHRIQFTPLFGLLYILFGIFLLICKALGYFSEIWFLSFLLIPTGIVLLVANFFTYTVFLMNNEQ